MRILCDGFGWFDAARSVVLDRHELLVLSPEQVDAMWTDPAIGWADVLPAGPPPDVALFCCPEYHLAPPRLAELPCPVALWVGDWYVNGHAISWLQGQADLVLADAAGVRALARMGFADARECSPWTFDPALHRPDWDAAPTHDVGFVGNLNDAVQLRRNRWLARAARLPADISVRIGNGIHGEDYARFLQRSRLTLNVSVTGDVNMRCFEAAACGSVILMDEQARERVAPWFDPGREIVFYGEQDLEAIVVELLSDDARREEIARAAWARVQEYAPGRRVVGLLAELEALATRGRGAAREPVSRANARAAAYALDVEAPIAPDTAELLLDRELSVTPDAALHLTRGHLYARLSLTGHEQAGAAHGWAREQYLAAAALDPADATAAISFAQLAQAHGDDAGAHAIALDAAHRLADGRLTARTDRAILNSDFTAKLRRQRALYASDDPVAALGRALTAEALRVAADTTDDLQQRAALQRTAARAVDDDPHVRLELATTLLAIDASLALPVTAELVDELPLNVPALLAHAHALHRVGDRAELEAFNAVVRARAARTTGHFTTAQLERFAELAAAAA